MEASETPTGVRCEFKTYHTAPKKNGELETKTITEPFGKLSHNDDDTPYALVIKRKFTDKYELDSTTLTINSPYLLQAFRDVVGTGYTTVASDFKSPFELSSPFQILIHYWDEFEQHQKETQDSFIRQHLKLLLDFMQHEMGPERTKVQAMIAKGQINYLQAWVIFRPGDLLYANVMGHPWLLRCQKTAYEVSTTAGPYITVSCTYTDHDGIVEGTADYTFHIFQKKAFGAENPAFITDLPVYPSKFAKEGDDLHDRLIARGRKFLDRKGASVQEYDGIAQFLKEPPYTWFDPDMAQFEGVWLPFTETGKIILDRKTFQEDEYSNQVAIKVAEPEPLLCPPYALGYSLSRKDWCRFFVDSTKDVKWKQNVWETLILSDEQKRVLQALVTSHSFPENARDQPEQKGKGLVILLHGSPGSGKTLTAETSAEGSQKALVSTSLGELNKDNIPWLFEYRLKRILQYATMWKAIVLLDEADVFLETRENAGQSDGKRNSLVAVFLKELEYFSGIVFLTTNRLASFDEAMKSRIHLALGYSPPDVRIREQIWTQVLRSVPAGEMGIEDIDDAVESVLQEVLNGREISNAVNTARTIARSEKVPLRLEHIDIVLQVRHEFDKSMQKEARRLKAGRTATGSEAGGLLRQGSILLTADHGEEK